LIPLHGNPFVQNHKQDNPHHRCEGVFVFQVIGNIFGGNDADGFYKLVLM
jgi:hypothetical protein